MLTRTIDQIQAKLMTQCLPRRRLWISTQTYDTGAATQEWPKRVGSKGSIEESRTAGKTSTVRICLKF
jgi:hypothetical protein